MTVQVGTKDGWYVGDKAYVWKKDCEIPEFSGTFSRWVVGEIITLFNDGGMILQMSNGGIKLVASTASIYTKTAIHALNDAMFLVGTRVIILTPFPQVGILGTVITLDEAQQKGANPYQAKDGFVPVMLDRDYAGGWYPESLGVIADPVAATSEPEPKNNDDRNKCFWCGSPTKTIELAFSTGAICTQCGR